MQAFGIIRLSCSALPADFARATTAVLEAATGCLHRATIVNFRGYGGLKFSMKYPLLIVFLAVLFLGLFLPTASQAQKAKPTPTPTLVPINYKLVGVYIQWSGYERKFLMKDLQTNGTAAKLTHLYYAFANVGPDLKCYEGSREGWGDAFADYGRRYKANESVSGGIDTWGQRLKGAFNQIKQLKRKNRNLKAIISIGGPLWSGRFSDAAMPDKRQAFVKSCIDMFIRGNMPLNSEIFSGGLNSGWGVFDGIDINWQYPAAPGYQGNEKNGLPPNVFRPEDTENYTALLAEFRTQLDARGKLDKRQYSLTITTPTNERYYSRIQLNKVYQYVDFINVTTFDLYGPWSKFGPTTFSAPLFPVKNQLGVSPDSVDGIITDYLNAGVPPEKLVLGVSFTGNGWTNVPDKNNGLFQSSTAMEPAPGTFAAGFEDYKVLKTLNLPQFRDPETQSLWLFDGKTFWSYDDPTVIAAKMDYVKQKKLGGAMGWSLDGDDGTLISTMRESLQTP